MRPNLAFYLTDLGSLSQRRRDDFTSKKGIVGATIIGAIAWVRKFTPQKVFNWLLFGCAVFVGVILWNLYSLGVIG